jgi:ABC-2 type transport system permease protein
MRLLIVFQKTCRELLRDPWVLGLTLAFAPFFVFLYWLWTQGGSTAYTVLTINHDRGALLASGEKLAAGEEAIHAIRSVAYTDGSPLLKTRTVPDRAEAEKLLRERSGVVFVKFPENFSQAIAALRRGDRSVSTQIEFGGDLTNVYYTIGSVLALTAVDGYIAQSTGQQPLVGYNEQPLGASAARSEFETYVPGVLIFAVIMLIFVAAMTTAREVERGTLRRLQITPMSAFDLLGGITLTVTLIGVISVVLTFLTAQALGFRSQGPVWAAVLIGAFTALSITGIGMLTACFARTVSQAFVVANFPLGLLMFFSGAIMPMPKATLITIGGLSIGLYDFLPPTHAVAALNKILTLGASLQDVAYEITALVVLSILYLAMGMWLFQRKFLSR